MTKVFSRLVNLIIIFVCFFVPTQVFASEAHFTFSTTTPDGVKAFSNYFFTLTGVPTTLNYQGLKGTITLSPPNNEPSPFLVQFTYYPAGTCPQSGIIPAGAVNPPNRVVLQSFIVNVSPTGTQTLPIDISLPYKYPITNGCFTIYYSGGDHVNGLPVTINTDISMQYDTEDPPAIKPKLMGTGFEVCIGLNSGCTARKLTTTPGEATAVYFPVKNDLVIKALNGNISYGSLEVPRPPLGAWSASTDYYVVPRCVLPPNPNVPTNSFFSVYGPAAEYKDPPAGAIPFYQNSINLNGRARTLVPVAQENLSVPVKTGDCVLAIAKLNGDGGMHNETQLFLELIPGTGYTSDLNGDGTVNIFDYNVLIGAFGKTGSNIVGDIDTNGKVDIFDYNELVTNFGK